MTRQALLNRLADVDCQLSPENLCGDGEFSRSYVNKRLAALTKQRNELLAKLGRLPAPTANLEITIA